MKNIITASKKLAISSIATIATLSVLSGFTVTKAAAEDPRASLSPRELNQTYHNGHGYNAHKYRAHKKHYKRKKRVKRVRKQVPAYHYYNNDNDYYSGKTKHRRRNHSGHYDGYHNGNGNGSAVAAGIIGFALGTILSSERR